jgi:hypothetical protein
LPCAGWNSNTKLLSTKGEFFSILFFHFILCFVF